LGKSDHKIGFYSESYPLYLTIVYGKLSSLRSKVPIKFGINYFGQYNSSENSGRWKIQFHRNHPEV